MSTITQNVLGSRTNTFWIRREAFLYLIHTLNLKQDLFLTQPRHKSIQDTD